MVKTDKPYLKLWLKFMSEFEQSTDGVVILSDNFHNEHKRQKIYNNYLRRVEEKYKNKLYRFQIYQHPGNRMIHEETFDTWKHTA